MLDINDDGLTTAQRRLRPIVIVNTGDGKGKTTAAMGTALRAWTQGWSVGVYQFIKSGKWNVGEQTAFDALGQLHKTSGQGGPVTWEIMGSGWTWLPEGSNQDARTLAQQGWNRIRDLLAEQTHDLYVLDEFAHVLRRGWVNVDEVIETLAGRPGTQHVIITGRGAPDALISAADIVTNMDKVKHVFDSGQRGQAGIEW